MVKSKKCTKKCSTKCCAKKRNCEKKSKHLVDVFGFEACFAFAGLLAVFVFIFGAIVFA